MAHGEILLKDVAIVTGASRGIGQEVAYQLKAAKDGGDIAACFTVHMG